MRNLLLITDLGNGTVQVSWQQGNAVPKTYRDSIQFADPLTEEDREELRWYLEDFLRFPYGAQRWNAAQVERKMEQLGEALFKQVFIETEADLDPRAFYLEAVRDGLDKCELCISSDDPAFLAIPWELIRDPDPEQSAYLASLLKGLYRRPCQIPVRETASKAECQGGAAGLSSSVFMSEIESHIGMKRACRDAATDPEGPFRILLIVARPYEQDVAMGMVARPVIEALRPMRSMIELELLRPPTFAALQQKLTDNPGYYHLVHFDGHGTLIGDDGPGPQGVGGRTGSGHLVFETDNGGGHMVTSQALGQALQNAKVPLFVMNACRSAQEGTNDPFSSVASGLVGIGTNGVVGMSYSVYATAAARFMERFYSKLATGSTLSDAVAAGRMRLHLEKGHESPVGATELQDWMVPILYQQETGFVPVHGPGSKQAEDKSEAAAHIQQVREKVPEGQFGFIGRDNEILRLERALRNDDVPWVIISGTDGIGKTELAYGFGRWYAETGGCPAGVFVTSFRDKADLGQVISSIEGFGTDFSMHPPDELKEKLVDFLKENPCLLIWDDFETVAGYPDGEHAYASDEDRKELAEFLKALGGGKSRVVITTRHPGEEWLGVAASVVEIGGLTKWDAGQMAANVLRTVGKKPGGFRNNEKYDALLGLLSGHPLSLEVLLPFLKWERPENLIDKLEYEAGDPGSKLADESLRYAFSRIPEDTRELLLILGLFSSKVTPFFLGLFTSVDRRIWAIYPHQPEKIPDIAEWEVILGRASDMGLGRFITDEVFQMHPMISKFLRDQLVDDLGEITVLQLEVIFIAFYAGMSAIIHLGVQERNSTTLDRLLGEEANLLRALRLAERLQDWEMAQDILGTLCVYYEGEGRLHEWLAMHRRMLGRVGREMPRGATRARANLWIFLLDEEAHRAIGTGDFDHAKSLYQLILDYLLPLVDPEEQYKIATVYHQLGVIAHDRHEYDEAEEWYKKAFDLSESFEEEDTPAKTCHQLGKLAEQGQRYDEARNWYKKSAQIYGSLDQEDDAADEYHQLGLMAQKRQRYDEAIKWYERAFGIFDMLGMEGHAADEYHQLGLIAQERQRYNEAENWYAKALDAYDSVEHPPVKTRTLRQLGLLYKHRSRFHEAVHFAAAGFLIAAVHTMDIGRQLIEDLARLFEIMGDEEFAAAWSEAVPSVEPPVDHMREILTLIPEAEEPEENAGRHHDTE